MSSDCRSDLPPSEISLAAVVARQICASEEHGWGIPRRVSPHNRSCFIVRDNGQALAYVYFETEPGKAHRGPSAHKR